MQYRFLAALVFLARCASAAFAQAPANMPPYTPPKTADGQPDIQGIWQVLNTAAWDLQDHGARLGVPAGRGVVDGQRDPVPARGAREEEGERREARDARSRIEVLSVGRAAHHVHAVPVPDRAAGRQGQRPLRVQPHASGRST